MGSNCNLSEIRFRDNPARSEESIRDKNTFIALKAAGFRRNDLPESIGIVGRFEPDYPISIFRHLFSLNK